MVAPRGLAHVQVARRPFIVRLVTFAGVLAVCAFSITATLSVVQGPQGLYKTILYDSHENPIAWPFGENSSLAYPLLLKEPTLRIFDIVLYNGELDMLLFRYKVEYKWVLHLHLWPHNSQFRICQKPQSVNCCCCPLKQTLDPVVDVFIVAESNVTFSQKPKPLYFERDKPRFREFQHKIRHVVVDDMPDGTDAWANEIFQRNAAKRGLFYEPPVREQDLIILSDADEVPDPR